MRLQEYKNAIAAPQVTHRHTTIKTSNRDNYFSLSTPQQQKEMEVKKTRSKRGKTLALSQCICFTLRSHNIAWLRLVPPLTPLTPFKQRRPQKNELERHLHPFQQYLSSAQSSSCHLWLLGMRAPQYNTKPQRIPPFVFSSSLCPIRQSAHKILTQRHEPPDNQKQQQQKRQRKRKKMHGIVKERRGSATFYFRTVITSSSENRNLSWTSTSTSLPV